MKNKLNFLHICDYASAGDNGKLNVLGIFENIFSNEESMIHPQLFIVSNVSTSQSGNFKEIIKIVREKDGFEIVKPIEFNISTPSTIDKSKETKIGFIGQFNGVKFEELGSYLVQVFIDEEKIGEQKFTISKPPVTA